jgi:NTE family protein
VLKVMPRRAWATCLIGVLFTAGCVGARIENARLSQYQHGVGYGAAPERFPPGQKVRVILAFSGGGTRAAALAYGVLKELKGTEVVVAGKKTRLLDEVSLISSVSGGSFTSAYYGLHGEGIFDDFEERFLRRNIEGLVALNLLRPLKLARVAFTGYTRSDLAIDVYDKEVFGGATFKDLARAGGPVLNINATDIDIGTVFTFIQPNFDMICSDLSQLRVAQAVTASSAVPGIFAPLLLQNYAGSCDHPQPEWIGEALAHPRESRRRYHDARSVVTYLDSKKRPYLFLVDGVVADNIGARRIIADVVHAGGAWNLAEDTELSLPEHVVYIVVNAEARRVHKWDDKPAIPSLTSVLRSISSTGIYRYNFETIELLRESAARWQEQMRQHGEKMNASVVEVSFDDLTDPAERKFFNAVKTSFTLDDTTVDRLIEVGGRLLRESPDFRDFLEPLQ